MTPGMRGGVIVTCLCLSSAAASAQTTRVEFTLRSPREIVNAQGVTTTIVIAVANGGDAPLPIRPMLSLPPRWRVLAGGEAFTIPRRGKDLWLLTLIGPAAPPAGRYTLGLGASIGSARVWTDSIVTVVGRRLAARVRAPTGEQFAPADGAITLRYVVRNTGNAAVTLNADAQSPLPGPLRVIPSRLDLALGDTAVVSVTVGAPPRIDQATLRRVILSVSAEGRALDSAQSEALFVPQSSGNATRSLPVRVALRTAGRANKQVSPAIITSHGALDEAGRWILDLDARGPGPRFSPFGERDHYLLDLRGRGTVFQFGDIIPEQSRLTEPRWQQFGGAARVTGHGVSFAGFAARDRYFESRGSSAGGSLAFRLPNDGNIGMNGTFYQGSTTNGGGVGSASTNFTLPGSVSVEAEGAAGLEMTKPMAGVARIARHGRRVWLDAELMRADSAFPGPLHGSKRMLANGGLRLFAGISVHASTQDYTVFRPTLPAYDSIAFPNGPPSPAQRTLENVAGISFAGLGSVDVVRRETEGGGRDEILRGTTSLRVKRLSFVATGEDGRRTTATSSTPAWRAGLSIGFSSNPFNANVFGEYSSSGSNRNPDPRARGRQLSSGASATLLVGRSWRASLLALGNGSVATGVAWDSTSLYLADFSIAHDFTGGQSLALRVRSQRSAVRWFTDQTLVLLDFSLPLSLRLPSSGSKVTGRVVDQVTGDPVANALVRLGEAAAITDRSGRVSFPSMRAGTYPLAVSSGSAAANGTRPGVRAPASLEVDGRRSLSFHADMYPATRTLVTIRRWQRAETQIGQKPVDSLVLSDEPLEPLTVRFVNGTDTLRRVVSNGALDLGSELYPGLWVAAVEAAGMPQGFEPRVAEATFVVQPRVDAVVTIDLVATLRIPKVLPGGEIKVVPPPKSTPKVAPKPTPRPKAKVTPNPRPKKAVKKLYSTPTT